MIVYTHPPNSHTHTHTEALHHSRLFLNPFSWQPAQSASSSSSCIYFLNRTNKPGRWERHIEKMARA
jgi:hypothetical protein